MAPDSTKEDRKKYFKSTLQPWRDGVPSKEYVEAYPDIAKETLGEDNIKKAKNVWYDLPNWKNRHKTL